MLRAPDSFEFNVKRQDAGIATFFYAQAPFEYIVSNYLFFAFFASWR